jgi:hypothetical protein
MTLIFGIPPSGHSNLKIVMNTSLRDQLIAMANEDKRVRAELAATGELFGGYAPRMAEVHSRNAAQLAEIIAQYGWPGTSLVGEDGSEAAWLILQHAIGNPDLQRRSLPLLEKAAASGDIKAAHVAYLHDRICFFERRPQRYGTQFDWDKNGQMTPWKLEAPERVDEYRHSVGLEPLASKIAEAQGNTKGETPPDFQKRQGEMLTWAKSVGWNNQD